MHQNAEKMWEKTSHTHISAWLQKQFRSMEAWYKDFAFCIPNVAKNQSEDDHMAQISRSQTWSRIYGYLQPLGEKSSTPMTAKLNLLKEPKNDTQQKVADIYCIKTARCGIAWYGKDSTGINMLPTNSQRNNCVVLRVSVDVILGLLIMFLNCLFMLDSQPHPPKVFSHS